MGFHIHGSITIDPPLNWAQIRALPSPEDIVRVEKKTEEQTDEGTMVRRFCDTLVPAYANLERPGPILKELQKIIYVAGEGHAFTGHFTCVDDDTYEQFRIYVDQSHAAIVYGVTIWPADIAHLKRAVDDTADVMDTDQWDDVTREADRFINGWHTRAYRLP